MVVSSRPVWPVCRSPHLGCSDDASGPLRLNSDCTVPAPFMGLARVFQTMSLATRGVASDVNFLIQYADDLW
jgi:hypothetical protein